MILPRLPRVGGFLYCLNGEKVRLLEISEKDGGIMVMTLYYKGKRHYRILQETYNRTLFSYPMEKLITEFYSPKYGVGWFYGFLEKHPDYILVYFHDNEEYRRFLLPDALYNGELEPIFSKEERQQKLEEFREIVEEGDKWL